jgi:arylsulfatase A-like enzyme
VHTKLAAPPALVKKYKRKFDHKYGPGSAEKIYGPANKRHQAKHVDNPWLAAMLERVDAGAGAVMEALQQAGLADNTLVVFFSVIGGAHGVANNGGLRGYKTWLYEGGIREPLIMRWPGRINPATVSDVPVCSIDFYPTFLQVAGAQASAGQVIDGTTLVTLLEKGKSPGRSTLFWYYPAETGGWKNRMAAAIRQEDYKLIHFFVSGRSELFNLKADPDEKTDLSEQMPARTRSLQKKLRAWEKAVKAKKPVW